MTDQLERSVELSLERHARLGPDPRLDLESVRARGRQHSRRRRVVLVGAVTAAAVLVLGVPVVVSQLSGGEQGEVAVDAASPFAEPLVSWSKGSSVRAGDLTIEVGAEVTAYVLTDRGVVAVDPEGTVRFADGTAVREIGTTGRTFGRLFGRLLVSDGTAGPEVAWYDTGAEQVVVYDTASGRVQLRLPEPLDATRPEFDVPTVRALDDGAVWVYAAGRVTEYDARTGAEVSGQIVEGPDSMDDVQRGLTASELEGGGTEVSDWRRSRILRALPGNGRATLSTGGSYVATESSETRVFTVDGGTEGEQAAGDDVTPDLGRYAFHRVVRWLDDDRYQAFALEAAEIRRADDEGKAYVGDFVVCSVADGTCSTVAGGAAAFEEGQALPWGEPRAG